MQFSDAELSTLKNNCWVANERYRQNIAELEAMKNTDYGEAALKRLIEQFQRQIAETLAIVVKLEDEGF